MEGLPRLQASRRGYRAHVTKTFGRITEITQSTEPITPTQMILLRTVLEQLQQRKVTLEEKDVRIANAIEDVTALEEEICEVEEYKTLLTLSFRILSVHWFTSDLITNSFDNTANLKY